MELSVWASCQVLAKCLIYAGFAANIGGPFVARLAFRSNTVDLVVRRYCLVGLIAAVIATVLLFFAQVGALSDSGLSGMWDPQMINLLWQSQAGTSLLLRLLGSGLVLVALIISASKKKGGWQIIKYPGYVIGVLLLAISFVLVGHTSQLSVWVKVTLWLHFIAVAWWIGSLWPLRRSCTVLDTDALYDIMHRFGRYALFVVAGLSLAGVVLAWQLLESWQTLITTPYGQILLGKLFLVSLILLLAAWHKLRLTPKLLHDSKAGKDLANSIGLESVLALSILFVTACLTTLTGPGH
jgi:putative copper resistance protein D